MIQSISRSLKICFVHTPMASVHVEGRNEFWHNFDKRYYAAHPKMKPADSGIWELPHWMTWLAGVLRAEGYNNISNLGLHTAVDSEIGIDTDAVRQLYRDSDADVFLYSPMTPNLHLAYQMADIAKQEKPNCRNIFGGVIATPLHCELAKQPSVDYVVFDRGEYALPALLAEIEHGKCFDSLKNLCYRKDNGEIWVSPDKHPFMHPRDLPFPNYDMFPSWVGKKLRYIRQNYALGCPFRCSFCTIQTIGMKQKYFPLQRVLNEIRAYRGHYGKEHNIYFGDETFILNKQKTLEICKALAAEGNITYDIQTRFDTLGDIEILSALRRSGCQWVEIGLETLVQDSLNAHKQRINFDKNKDVLRRVRDAGLPLCSFIVNGFPDQTVDDMKYTIDAVCLLLEEQLLHASYFFGLVPYPGSLMYQTPEKYGMKLRHRQFKYYNEDLLPVYDTEQASAEQIYDVFHHGISMISDAMSSQPYLGTMVPEDFFEYCGKSLTHV